MVAQGGTVTHAHTIMYCSKRKRAPQVALCFPLAHHEKIFAIETTAWTHAFYCFNRGTAVLQMQREAGASSSCAYHLKVSKQLLLTVRLARYAAFSSIRCEGACVTSFVAFTRIHEAAAAA